MSNNNCTNCNEASVPCGCKDAGILTPPPCGPGVDCPEGTPCSEIYPLECTSMTGDPILCGEEVVIESGLSVTQAFVSMIAWFCNAIANLPPGPQGPPGEQGEQGEQGDKGDQGDNGTNGFSGRGIAVFVQDPEPTQTDFDNQYGNIQGFGVNGTPGSSQIKAGDLWIEDCLPVE